MTCFWQVQAAATVQSHLCSADDEFNLFELLVGYLVIIIELTTSQCYDCVAYRVCARIEFTHTRNNTRGAYCLSDLNKYDNNLT